MINLSAVPKSPWEHLPQLTLTFVPFFFDLRRDWQEAEMCLVGALVKNGRCFEPEDRYMFY